MANYQPGDGISQNLEPTVVVTLDGPASIMRKPCCLYTIQMTGVTVCPDLQ